MFHPFSLRSRNEKERNPTNENYRILVRTRRIRSQTNQSRDRRRMHLRQQCMVFRKIRTPGKNPLRNGIPVHRSQGTTFPFQRVCKMQLNIIKGEKKWTMNTTILNSVSCSKIRKKEKLYFRATGEDKGVDGIEKIARDIIKKRNLDEIERIMVTDYNDYDENHECYNEFYLQI